MTWTYWFHIKFFCPFFALFHSSLLMPWFIHWFTSRYFFKCVPDLLVYIGLIEITEYVLKEIATIWKKNDFILFLGYSLVFWKFQTVVDLPHFSPPPANTHTPCLPPHTLIWKFLMGKRGSIYVFLLALHFLL